MDIDIKTRKKTRQDIYKPTTTIAEQTLDTTRNIKNTWKIAKNTIKSYPKKGSVSRMQDTATKQMTK